MPTTAATLTASSTTVAPGTSTETTDVETSAAPSTEGSTDASTTGADAVWHRYTLDVSTGAWTQIALDELWTDPNAPPPSGIAAASSLTHFDRLHVLTDDSMFYEQSDGTWLSPVPLAERFPMAAGANITGMAHTPGQTPGDTSSEDILLVDTPLAILYTQQENGGTDFVETRTLDDVRGGAPQGSVSVRWYFVIADPSGIGSGDIWYQLYSGLEDGDLWRFDNGFQWAQWPQLDNPFFTGAAGEPDPSTLEAAYHDDAFGRLHFIGP